MGFFTIEQAKRDPMLKGGLSIDVLHKKQCAVCPLNLQQGLHHPHMKASGAKRPLVYILGEAPGKVEDRKGIQFVGQSGDTLRLRVPESWIPDIRWNNVVRTRPPDNRDPTRIEIECCRPSIIADIEEAMPKAIFGFGNIPLEWAIKETRITAWAGRRIPIKVGNHKCWFFPMLHPSGVMRTRRFVPTNPKRYGSDTEFKFALDFKAAFRSIDKLSEPVIHTREDALAGIEFVTGHKKEDLEKVLDYIAGCWDEALVGLDYETNRIRPYRRGSKILTAALATSKSALAFPLNHRSAGWNKNQLEIIKKEWRKFLLKAKCKKVSHHLAFEHEWSAASFGIDTVLGPGWEDSMSQAYILDERWNGLSLDFLCLQHFGLSIKDLHSVDRKNMADEPLENILPYNGLDAKYHRALFIKQTRLLKKAGLQRVYAHQVRRVTAASLTTYKGVPVDPEVVEDFYEVQTKLLDKAHRAILELPIAEQFKRRFGYDLRPSNNIDIAKALTQLAGVKLKEAKSKSRKVRTDVKVTKRKKALSTNEAALLEIKHPLARKVLKWRKISKLISTYITCVRHGSPHLYPDTLMHPIVSTTKTVTWRTSSEDPNAQNWPKRGPNKFIRKQIAVDDDHRIVAIDYAGIQARNVAMESLDKSLVQHYLDRYDIHGDWLNRLKRLAPNWIPKSNIGKDLDKKQRRKEERNVVKNKFVFPSFFGAVGKTIAGSTYLGIDEHKGERLSEEFFDEYPDVKAWQEELRKFYQKHGYVTGHSEFRRRAPIEINQLINAPIQADETIIVCDAWARLCETGDKRAIPILMVHDDLTFVWHKNDVDKMLEKVIPIMLHQVRPWEKIVPMEVEVAIGQNWCDLKDLGKFEIRNGIWCEVTDDKGSDRWDYKIGQEGVPLSRQQGWEKD